MVPENNFLSISIHKGNPNWKIPVGCGVGGVGVGERSKAKEILDSRGLPVELCLDVQD